MGLLGMMSWMILHGDYITEHGFSSMNHIHKYGIENSLIMDQFQ